VDGAAIGGGVAAAVADTALPALPSSFDRDLGYSEREIAPPI